MSTSSRIVKNTGFLYLKMGITVFFSLWATRIVLESLGAVDFGIFNIIGGSIAMLGFLNSTLANATQRFMSYSLGEGILENQKQIFNISLILHVIIAIVTALMLLSITDLLFSYWLNIPADRVMPAKIIYLALIISTVLTIINVPYDAMMNAHENMKYYSYISILDVSLRLSIAYIVAYTDTDRLVLYGCLMAAIPLITLSITRFYCHRHYQECIFAPRKYWSVQKIKEIACFSGWNFLTAISSLLTFQGIGLVLNHFYGSALNAAQGIANQLNGYMSSFSINLMKAVNPVIVKKAGSKDLDSMNSVTLSGAKLSTLLMMFFSIPCIVEIDYVLKLWLKEVPDWTASFCIMIIITSIIVEIASPFSTAVYAQGKIKCYAIYKSIANILPLICTWVAFRLGGSPYWLYIPMIAIWAVGGNYVIIHYSVMNCGLKLKSFNRDVLLPVAGIAVVMFTAGYLTHLIPVPAFIRLCLCCVSTTAALFASTWMFGLTSSEKDRVKELVKRFIHRRQNL